MVSSSGILQDKLCPDNNQGDCIADHVARALTQPGLGLEVAMNDPNLYGSYDSEMYWQEGMFDSVGDPIVYPTQQDLDLAYEQLHAKIDAAIQQWLAQQEYYFGTHWRRIKMFEYVSP